MNSRMVPLAIPSEAIHPAHGSGVAIAQQVEQAAALGSLSELCADAGDAFIPDELIKPESQLLCLGTLVLNGRPPKAAA
jgi:hypothetical protein